MRSLLSIATAVAFVASSSLAHAADSPTTVQTTASQHFGQDGRFAGLTVFDVAERLRTGKLSPADVPVEYIVRDGNRLILNTRSTLALKQAGVPESKWMLTDRTGEPTFEKILTERLVYNSLSSAGTDTLRLTGSGKKASTYR